MDICQQLLGTGPDVRALWLPGKGADSRLSNYLLRVERSSCLYNPDAACWQRRSQLERHSLAER